MSPGWLPTMLAALTPEYVNWLIGTSDELRSQSQPDDPMAYTCGHQEAFGGYALACCPGYWPDTGCGIEWTACEQCRDKPEVVARAQAWIKRHKCKKEPS